MLKYINIHNDNETLAALLERAVLEFEAVHAVSLTFHDQRGIFYDRDGRGCLVSRQAHGSDYCRFKRYAGRGEFDRNCLRDCAAGVEHHAQRSGVPFIFDCWKGARELVVPIRDGAGVAFLLYAGSFRGESVPRELVQKWEKLPVLEEARIPGLTAALTLFGQGLLGLFEPGRRELEPSNRREIIRRALWSNAHRKYTLAALGRVLGVSPSRASHLCREALGVSFQESLLAARMKKAALLLEQSDLPQKEVARQCGFSGICYFSSMFRKFYQTTPAKFRSGSHGIPENQ